MRQLIPGGDQARRRLMASLSNGGAQQAIIELVGARLELDAAAGVVVAVTDELGTLAVVACGLADEKTGTPMRPDAVMPFGSIGKTFTSIAALQLVEAGRLDLHLPLDAYLPWLDPRSCRDTSGLPVTTHHLLTHTSGLPLGTEYCDCPQHVAWAWGQRLGWAAPGRRLSYSNDGFKILGVIIEAVSGKTADRYVAEHVMDALSMGSSKARITAEDRCRAATGYVRGIDGGPGLRWQPRCEAPWVVGASADGSVIGSAPDLCALVRALLRGGLADRGDRLLSPASWATMSEGHVTVPAGMLGSLGPEARLGYGLFSGEIDGHRCIWHPGRMPGYSALFLADTDDRLGVVVLANGEAHVEQIGLQALRAARNALRGADPPPLPVTDPSVCEAPASFAGTFVAGEADTVPREVTLRSDDRYVTLIVGNEFVRLQPVRFQRDTFLAPDPEWEHHPVRVLRDPRGRPVLVTHGRRWWGVTGAECDADIVRLACPPPPTSVAADRLQGRYSSHNLFFPCIDVFVRCGGLVLSIPGSLGQEWPLWEIEDRVFRVGAESWRPERLVFDAFIDGRPTRARLDFEAYYRDE